MRHRLHHDESQRLCNILEISPSLLNYQTVPNQLPDKFNRAIHTGRNFTRVIYYMSAFIVGHIISALYLVLLNQRKCAHLL